MKNSKVEICFIGNAIVDILSKISNESLNKLKIPKGSMQLVDEESSDKILKYIDFATFLEDNQKRGSSMPINQLVYDLYKKFIDYNTLEVYKNNLEKENLDYRYVIKEYREGLLLFNLMQEKIWTIKESDSTQLKSFFENNRDKYIGYVEDKGKIIGDFQNTRESKWLNNLKLKHKVTLNKKAIKRLRKKYN